MRLHVEELQEILPVERLEPSRPLAWRRPRQLKCFSNARLFLVPTLSFGPGSVDSQTQHFDESRSDRHKMRTVYQV
jgi:hypothetical protein